MPHGKKTSAVKQLTIRGFDRKLERWLWKSSQQEGISLNRAALRALRRGAGLEREAEQAGAVGKALERFIGSWSRAEESELLHAIEVFARVDESLWS